MFIFYIKNTKENVEFANGKTISLNRLTAVKNWIKVSCVNCRLKRFVVGSYLMTPTN